MLCEDERPKFYRNPQPMQHVRFDARGVARFRENAIVRWMLDRGKQSGAFDLHTLAFEGFSGEDWEQFVQLIGYSVSGSSDYTQVSDATLRVADMLVDELIRERAIPCAQVGDG